MIKTKPVICPKCTKYNTRLFDIKNGDSIKYVDDNSNDFDISIKCPSCKKILQFKIF